MLNKEMSWTFEVQDENGQWFMSQGRWSHHVEAGRCGLQFATSWLKEHKTLPVIRTCQVWEVKRPE
jgi:hypothetical protein